MASGWSFGRRQGRCAECETPFVEGDPVFSLLRVQEELLQRGDLCGACFEARDPAQDVIFWRTAHSQKREALRIDFDLVLAAVPELARDARDERRDLAFLLALLLVRHRRLRLLGVTRKKGEEYLILRPVRSQDSFEVPVRDLDADRRSRLTGRLGELFDPTREGGLEDWLGTEPADSGAAGAPAVS